MRPIRTVAVALVLLAGVLPVLAPARQLTDADYAQAAKFLSASVDPLVDHAVQRVHWLDATHFWYRDHDAAGDHFLEMDAATGKVVPAFDQVKLAAALGKARGKPVAATRWPRAFAFRRLPNGGVDALLSDVWYRCDLAGAAICTPRAKLLHTGDEPGVVSPNGELLAFVRDWNLWVRDVATGKETQLTFDGVKNDGYATDNSGWVHSNGAVVKWSPDSRSIATYQQDQRGIADMYTVTTGIGHPKLEAWPYPLPGDKKVFMIQPVVLDVATRKLVRLKMEPEQRLSTVCDQLDCHSDGPRRTCCLERDSRQD